MELRKWAAEGLSFLTMEAEVKVCVFTLTDPQLSLEHSPPLPQAISVFWT